MKKEFWLLFSIQISPLTKKLSSSRIPIASASWWNIVTMAIYKVKSIMPKRLVNSQKKKTYGAYSTKWCWGCSAYIKRKSFTGILNVPTYFWQKMDWLNWVIWMYPKLLNLEFCKRKRVLHIMQVQRYGRINHMTISLTSGRWGVYYTSW